MTKFSIDTSRFLIDFCIEAYKPAAEIDVTQYGFELVRTFYDEKTDTEAFIAKDEGRIVVAFRGTESKEDVITDLKIKKLKHPPMRRIIFKARTHSGFLEAYQSIDEEVRASVRQILEDTPHVIYFTGHSLGGALAHLGALDIQTELNMPVSVYTFGSPRVGNRWFRRHYNKKMKDSWRVVNDEDVIPSIPMRILGYQHVDRLALIDEQKSIYVNPSKDMVKEKEKEGVASVLREGLHDHAASLYKELLNEIDNYLDVGVKGHH